MEHQYGQGQLVDIKQTIIVQQIIILIIIMVIMVGHPMILLPLLLHILMVQGQVFGTHLLMEL